MAQNSINPISFGYTRQVTNPGPPKEQPQPMAKTPRLEDDGSTVVLDLHGSNVSDALDTAKRALLEAAKRGRGSVKVIHGSSTTDALQTTRTIKTAINRLLESNDLKDLISSTWSTDGYVVISLDLMGTKDPTPIKVSDVYL